MRWALSAAFAASLVWLPTNADAQVVGITFTSPTVGSFSPVSLDGAAKVTSATVGTFSVSDARLVASGWRVTVSATQLCEQLLAATCALLPKTLPIGSLDQSAPSVTGPGPLPTTSAAPGIDSAPRTLASAAVGTGLGTFAFSASTLTMQVPAKAYAKTYVSTVTWTVASGP